MLASSTTVAFAQPQKKLPDAVAHKKMVTVGAITFDQLDLHYELAVDKCYGDTLAGLEAAALELVGEAIEQSVIKMAYHQEPPLQALRKKAQWMKENTLDSAKLKCVKDVFGNDSLTFYHLVVEPTLINPRLRQYFSIDTAVQKFPRDTIEMFWKLVKLDPTKLDQLARDTLRIPKGVEATSELQKLGAVPESDDPLVANVISKMKEGELWPNVIEDDQSYKILKLLYQTNSYYYVRELTVNKRPFDPWLQNYAKTHVPIIFHDKKLFDMINVRYPGVWWLDAAKLDG